MVTIDSMIRHYGNTAIRQPDDARKPKYAYIDTISVCQAITRDHNALSWSHDLVFGHSKPEMSHHSPAVDAPASFMNDGAISLSTHCPAEPTIARMLRRKLTKIELKPEDREEVGCILYLPFHSSLRAHMFD